jgi:hypothetical protein
VPSYERTRRFDRDYAALTEEQRVRFRAAFLRFDDDLRRGRFRPGLRVKRVGGTDRVFEMTWAPDGRATFQYGQSKKSNAHVIWRRIGTHEVFRRP